MMDTPRTKLGPDREDGGGASAISPWTKFGPDISSWSTRAIWGGGMRTDLDQTVGQVDQTPLYGILIWVSSSISIYDSL